MAPSDRTQIRGGKQSATMTMMTMAMSSPSSSSMSQGNHGGAMLMEDHSASSSNRYKEDILQQELDVLRSDSSVMPQPLPMSSRSCRNYTSRLFQTGAAQLRQQWKVLVAGQVLSFLTAATGAAQATLSFDCHLSAPTLTLGICYAFLSLTLFYLVYQERTQKGNAKVLPVLETCTVNDKLQGTLTTPLSAPFRFLGFIPLQAHPLVYLPMAILDVYANYFTILAFKYTTITSVTLFDALAIPSAMILSYVFLHRHYSPIHLAAVASCIFGILLNVWEDYKDDHKEESMTTKSGLLLEQIYPHRTTGDILAVVGGCLFGATNTAGEYAVRQRGGPYEYIGMMSFYAALICVVQTLLVERDDIAAFTRTDAAGVDSCSLATAQWLLVGFTMATVATYLGAARFLQVSDAAFFNLSLLTGDLWSVIFSIVQEGIVPGSLFFVALVFIVAGVIVYEMTEEPAEGDSMLQAKLQEIVPSLPDLDGNVEMAPNAFRTSMQINPEERAGLLDESS